MPLGLPSGRYIITNCRTRNVAVLPDGNEGFPLRGCVRGLFEERRGEQWNIVVLENGNYRIQNIDFNSFAGHDPYPAEKDEVLGKSKPQQWTIKQPFNRSPVCLISPSSNKDLFWGISMDEDGTPLTMSSISTDPRNHWLFKTIDALRGPPLDLDYAWSGPSEEMSGRVPLDLQPPSDFLRLMSALEVFFTNMARTTQGNGADSSYIAARSGVVRTLASMVAIFAIEHSLDVSVGGYTALVLTAFFGILCQQLSTTINIDKSVYIIDLFDQRITLSSDIWQSWEKVDKLLKDRQKNRAGYRYVEQGDYYIADKDDLIVPENWRATIKPGMVLEMGIIRRTSSLAGTRRCPGCDTLVVGVSPNDRDIQCTFCPCKFRVREEKVNSEMPRQRHASNSKQDGSVSLADATEYPEVHIKHDRDEREKLFFSRIHIILSTLTLPSEGRRYGLPNIHTPFQQFSAELFGFESILEGWHFS